MNIIYYRNNANEEWQSIPALKGDKGNDGATPIKGVDYFTEEDLEGIAEEAAALVDVPEVDLSGYATKDYVDEAVGNVDIPEVDLSAYALKTEIPDVSSYQTEAQVQALIDASLNAIGVAEDGEF